MYCKNCATPMHRYQAVCLRCGIEAGRGHHFCANCGQQLGRDSVMCMRCGAPNREVGNLGGQSKTTIALMCFFFGALGVHNFMMGENKKGIMKIVLWLLTCTSISSILAVIDFIRIITDGYTVDPQKMF